LVRELQTRGVQVVGVGNEAEPHPQLASSLSSYASCDLTDASAVGRLPLANIDAVISLAGLANVGDSFAQADRYKEINVKVLSVLGEQLLVSGLKPRVIAVSSGTVYAPQQAMPLTEDSTVVKSGSPYAESKLLMEKAALELRDRGLPCLITRPMNHSGPGQVGGFLIPDLYQKIMAAKQNDGVVKVGDLSTKRDYTDVRDVVRAYADLALLPEPPKYDIYNVCSGRSIAGTDILQMLLDATGTQATIKIEQDPALMRPNDAPNLYGSYARLQTETGWSPQIPLVQTIKDFVANS